MLRIALGIISPAHALCVHDTVQISVWHCPLPGKLPTHQVPLAVDAGAGLLRSKAAKPGLRQGITWSAADGNAFSPEIRVSVKADPSPMGQEGSAHSVDALCYPLLKCLLMLMLQPRSSCSRVQVRASF